MFSHILCPIDGSECSLEALDVAARLAAEQHAALSLLEVVDPAKASAIAFGDPMASAGCLDALEDDAKRRLEEAAARVKNLTPVTTQTEIGTPTASILSHASHDGCDLIVMGSHGRSGMARALIGSVAEGVVRHAAVPVLIVRWTRIPAPVAQPALT